MWRLVWGEAKQEDQNDYSVTDSLKLRLFLKAIEVKKKKKNEKKESLYKPYEQMSEQDKNI